MGRMLWVAVVAVLVLGQAVAAGERSGKGDERYRVVINHEEQYSIWFADAELPEGWRATDFVGTRQESLDHIEEVWTDMRPLSARRETALEIYGKLRKSAQYSVVINHEEQYSIWLAGREVPKGWEATGFTGTKEESLDHIEEVWTDMRPLERRRATALEIYKKLRREN